MIYVVAFALLVAPTCATVHNATCHAQCDSQASAAAMISDTKYLSSFLLSLQGKYDGEAVRLQILDSMEGFLRQSLEDFCAVTGCVADFQVTNNGDWYTDVKQDLTFAKLCDAYIVSGAWMPEFAAQGLVEPLGDRVRDQPTISWLDIYPSVRVSSARFKDEMYMVPLDGDVIEAVYRDDLIEQHGRQSPRTFADLADEAEFFHGKDLNGDGQADFGICFSTAQSDIAGWLFWASMSPFLQTEGTEEGVFFDPDTMEPKMREPIFRTAMETYKRLALASPFALEGETGWQAQNGLEGSYFDNGRCAFTFNFPGPVKMMISQQSGAKAANLTGRLSVRKLPGVACSDLAATSACPHSQDGVNYAPFYAGGGASGQIRASADEVKKDAMFDYFTWISDPQIGYHIAANPATLLDPFRKSHVERLDDPESPVSQAFLGYGWEERQLLPLKELVQDVFSHPNAALDVRIPGGNEYTEVETTRHLVRYWAGDATLDETIDTMVSGWQSVTHKYGLENQRNGYREGLGLGPYVPPAQAAGVWDETVETFFLVVAIGLGSLIVLSALGYTVKRFRKAVKAERARRKEHERAVHESFLDLTRLNCNMVLISYSNFVRGGELLKFERARELGRHVTLDTYEEANRFCKENTVVFLSHQWLGGRFPDPGKVHFEAACTMLEELIAQCALNPDMVYVWVDYTSIPQSNKMMQHMAIGSLQVYASLPKYFVCLVPDTKHECGHSCNAQSYLNRGWCRAEQWARVSCGGVDGMFSFTTEHGLQDVTYQSLSMTRVSGNSLVHASNGEWLDTSIQVCKGDFTDPEDRHRLKGVIAALWMYAVMTKDQDSKLFDAVESAKKDVFPPEFFPDNYIAIAEGVAEKLKTTDWKKAFLAGTEAPVVARPADPEATP